MSVRTARNWLLKLSVLTAYSMYVLSSRDGIPHARAEAAKIVVPPIRIEVPLRRPIVIVFKGFVLKKPRILPVPSPHPHIS